MVLFLLFSLRLEGFKIGLVDYTRFRRYCLEIYIFTKLSCVFGMNNVHNNIVFNSLIVEIVTEKTPSL